MSSEEYKQVIVIREDLKMSKGKTAVQAAHAAVEAVLTIIDSKRPDWIMWLKRWRQEGQKKIVVKVKDEKELIAIYDEALKLGLPSSLIADAGLTELPPGTRTAVGIGPAPSKLIDRITGHLKLL
jgi:PTH2 family peptidyl-tRNA hydrolase